MAFTLSSPAFEPNGSIPAEYTCDGSNQSPPLAWSDVPAGTQSFALTAHDPDAPMGDLTHWVLFNLPGNVVHLPAGVEGEGVPGENHTGSIGYTGPCPPRGANAHRYFFTLYALSVSRVGLDDGATREALENSFENHLLAQAELIGLYARAAD